MQYRSLYFTVNLMASKKLTLDIQGMQHDFFEDTALIGIASSMPAFRFCWLLNQSFGLNFYREPDLDPCMRSSGSQRDGTREEEQSFSIYECLGDCNTSRYLLYKLKVDKDSLLPEIGHIDYLWMIKSNTPEEDAEQFAPLPASVARGADGTDFPQQPVEIGSQLTALNRSGLIVRDQKRRCWHNVL